MGSRRRRHSAYSSATPLLWQALCSSHQASQGQVNRRLASSKTQPVLSGMRCVVRKYAAQHQHVYLQWPEAPWATRECR